MVPGIILALLQFVEPIDLQLGAVRIAVGSCLQCCCTTRTGTFYGVSGSELWGGLLHHWSHQGTDHQQQLMMRREF